MNVLVQNRKLRSPLNGESGTRKEKQYRGDPGGAADPCSRRRRGSLFPGAETEAGKEVPADLDDFDLEDEEEYLTEDEETEEKNE